MSVEIRKATSEDAAEIANVHINSWREAYKGLMPQDFLDDKPLIFRNRYRMWKRLVIDPTQIVFVAECSEKGIIGFVSGEKSRDGEYKDYAEITCLYLLKKYQRQQIGFKLLKNTFEVFQEQGFKKAHLWVLEENPTIKFYEKTGGRYNDHLKEDSIADQKINELCYVWDNLNFNVDNYEK